MKCKQFKCILYLLERIVFDPVFELHRKSCKGDDFM